MSPRTPEQNEEIRKQRTQSIVAAALELFAENGFDNTSIKQIAKKAKISKGLIYNYFDGKKDLLQSVIQKGMQMMPLDLAPPENEAQARHQLENTLDKIYESAASDEIFWKFYAELLLQLIRDENLSKEFEEEFNFYINFFVKLLDHMNDPNPESNGRLLAAQLDGVLLHNLYFEDYPSKQIFEQIKKIYLNDDTNKD